MVRFAALSLIASAMMAAPASAARTAPVETRGELPAGWVAGPPPSTEEQWRCASGDQGWKIARNGNGTVTLSRASYGRPPLSIALDDGVLWATNKGEWGGKVEWQAANSATRVDVMGGNPVAMMAFQDAVYVAAGLAHGVTIKEPFVEVQLVNQPGATARLHGHAQAQVRAAFLLEEAADLAGGDVGQVDLVNGQFVAGHGGGGAVFVG